MVAQVSTEDKGYMSRGRDVFIRLSLLTVIAVSCFLLLRPFLHIIVSGILIAIAIYPRYRKLTNRLRGQRSLAAALCTILLLAVVIVPCLLLAGTLTNGIRTIAHQVEAGRIDLPPAPPRLAGIPIIGRRITEFWTLCNTDLSEVVNRFKPQIEERIPVLLSASAVFGGTLLQFLLAILLTGFLLATSEKESQFADRIFARIFGEQGPEYKELITATIRSVTIGILGVAVIQTLFASLGFWFVGLPGAGLWAGLFLIAAVLQMGVLVLIPAVIYVFATQPTSHAVLFLGWSVIVGLMDNVLKPILLGRGSRVPMIVIFLGVLGGFIAMNLIGLFVGAVVLSVGYKLFMAWLDEGVSDVHELPNVLEQSSPTSVRV